MVQVVFKDDIGRGLEVAGGKLNVKIDPASNEALSVSDAGVKLILPAQNKAVKSIAVVENSVRVTYTDETTEDVALPAQTVDVKLQALEVTEDNKLKATLSDNTQFETDLSKFVDVAKAAETYWTEIKALPTFGDDVATGARGEEVQNLAGQTLGYFVKV